MNDRISLLNTKGIIMKKYFFMTSALILAACGGGSGGGPRVDTPVVMPAVRVGTVSSYAARSNEYVTNIAPEIGSEIGGSDDSIIAITNRASSAKTFSYKGKEYASYRLDSVRFWAADDIDENYYVTFDVDDNGKIIKVLEHEDEKVAELERDGDYSNVFSLKEKAVYKFQPTGYTSPVTDSLNAVPKDANTLIAAIQKKAALNKDQEAELINLINSSDDWKDDKNWTKETHKQKYELKGNLKYADFGYVVINDSDSSVMAGGYRTEDGKITNIDRTNFNDKNMTFHGTAYGAVGYSYKDDTDTPRYKSKQIQTDENATVLMFNNGQEKLTMPFNEYYTVNVNKNNDKYNIEFNGTPADGDFVFENTANNDANVRIDYYGADKSNPDEAVGTVYYERNDKNGFNHEFQAAFGVIRDK